MYSPLIVLLVIGLAFVVVGTLLRRYFYQKHTVAVEQPFIVLPPESLSTPPKIKYSLSIRVPRYMRTHESDEVVIEYFQGATYWVFEGLNIFLYEKLEMLPRALPRGLRGMFFAKFTDKVKPKLETELSVSVSSPKFSVVPGGWVQRKKGTLTPYQWYWDVSYKDPITSSIVIELSEEFLKYFSEILQGRIQIIFQVDVLPSAGLSYHLFKFLKSISLVLVRIGGVLIVCAGAFAIVKR